ncbi:hypothetical protein B0A49_01045 [Cryomyces minteri]|uniref:Uncharacterized protein n=1 Tax=Cryomyces minteri TaxID=331657 RepID=A0A4U0Y0G7_9PEZI|nr:hypothetical protein B0A49_01045 [Cryomyces minteri]
MPSIEELRKAIAENGRVAATDPNLQPTGHAVALGSEQSTSTSPLNRPMKENGSIFTAMPSASRPTSLGWASKEESISTSEPVPIKDHLMHSRYADPQSAALASSNGVAHAKPMDEFFRRLAQLEANRIARAKEPIATAIEKSEQAKSASGVTQSAIGLTPKAMPPVKTPIPTAEPSTMTSPSTVKPNSTPTEELRAKHESQARWYSLKEEGIGGLFLAVEPSPVTSTPSSKMSVAIATAPMPTPTIIISTAKTSNTKVENPRDLQAPEHELRLKGLKRGGVGKEPDSLAQSKAEWSAALQPARLAARNKGVSDDGVSESNVLMAHLFKNHADKLREAATQFEEEKDERADEDEVEREVREALIQYEVAIAKREAKRLVEEGAEKERARKEAGLERQCSAVEEAPRREAERFAMEEAKRVARIEARRTEEERVAAEVRRHEADRTTAEEEAKRVAERKTRRQEMKKCIEDETQRLEARLKAKLEAQLKEELEAYQLKAEEDIKRHEEEELEAEMQARRQQNGLQMKPAAFATPPWAKLQPNPLVTNKQKIGQTPRPAVVSFASAAVAEPQRSNGGVTTRTRNQSSSNTWSPSNGQLPSAPRRVKLSNLPRNHSPTTIQSLVFGGALETIFHTPMSTTAEVLFMQPKDCATYYSATSKGIDCPYEKRTVSVELCLEIEPISTFVQWCIEVGETRAVRAIGVEENWTIPAMTRLATRKGREVECVTDGENGSKLRVVEWRFCDVKDASAFKMELKNDDEWKHCNIFCAHDPCATSKAVHF